MTKQSQHQLLLDFAHGFDDSFADEFDFGGSAGTDYLDCACCPIIDIEC